MITSPTPRQAVPESVSIYQIFVRNFTPAGTFKAAAARLADIRALGFDWVYLTPIHPVGRVGRKGSAGSPYAIADYRRVDPELGSLEDFTDFVAAVRRQGLRLMIDVVYNHTSPDARLTAEHPEWYLHDREGNIARKFAEWSDVVDLDYAAPASRPGLWDELIDTLVYWRGLGVEGFRCDVASLVPRDFWVEARRRVNDADPATGQERQPTLWLAESVHPAFLLTIRDQGFGGWSEPELHDAFDLTYDYDGWQRLEQVWAGQKPLDYYLDYLEVQRALYPAQARKIRYLENHDQRRAAERLGPGPRLEAWSVFYQLLPGSTFVYMGQEAGIATYPSLFEKEPVPWDQGDHRFAAFFAAVLCAARTIKQTAPRFAYRLLGEGLVLLERRGPDVAYAALCNLDDRSGKVALPYPLSGTDLLSGAPVHLAGTIAIPRGALVVRLAR